MADVHAQSAQFIFSTNNLIYMISQKYKCIGREYYQSMCVQNDIQKQFNATYLFAKTKKTDCILPSSQAACTVKPTRSEEDVFTCESFNKINFQWPEMLCY